MVHEPRRRAIKEALRKVRTSETNAKNARENLRLELEVAIKEGASYGDLAKVLGDFDYPISRQRVEQIVKGR